MTTRISRIALVAIMGACASLTPVHAAQQAKAPVNAALRYWPQFMQLSEALRVDDMIDPVIAFIGDNSEEARKSESFVELRAETVTGLIRAASHTHCDWAIDTSDGIETWIPHLGHVRNAANLVLADARRLRVGGDGALIAERLAAALRMARHANDAETFLISGLVSASLFSYAHDQIVADLDAGRLGEDARRVLAEALAEFPDDDPFGMRRSIAAEGALLGAWLRREFSAGDGFDLSQLDFDSDCQETQATLGVLRALLVRGDAAELLVRLFEQAYKDIVVAWESENAKEELRFTVEANSQGRYGPLAKLLVFPLDRCWFNNAQAAAKLNSLKQRLTP